MKCKKCGFENSDKANFCRHCAHKLRDVCDCRVLNRPYDCGQNKCPGKSLLLKLLGIK